VTPTRPLACPACGSDELASVERLTGTCPGRFSLDRHGRVTFTGHADTQVDWDNSTTDGAECLACGWRRRDDDWADQLAPTAPTLVGAGGAATGTNAGTPHPNRERANQEPNVTLSVYVPYVGTLEWIDPGSGIVGSKLDNEPDRIVIDYEANRHGAVNIRTFADRVAHAADRHITRYPTIARAVVDADQLLWVGTFDPNTGVVDLGNSEPLESWLVEAAGREITDLDAELRTTSPVRPPHPTRDGQP
jgi:hypothetical protein